MNEQPGRGKQDTSEPSGDGRKESTHIIETIGAMLKRYPWLIVLLVAFLFVLLDFMGTFGPSLPNPDDYSCKLEERATDQDDSTTGQASMVQPLQQEEQQLLNYFAIENQLIITGRERDIDETKQKLRTSLKLKRECDLGFIRPRSLIRRLLAAIDAPMTNAQTLTTAYSVAPSALGSAGFGKKQKPVLRLYEVAEGSPLDAILEIQEIVQDPDYRGKPISADLNYLTGVLGQSQCGKPAPKLYADQHDPGGSPFEANQHDPGGSPVKSTPEKADYQFFWDQWAFEHIEVSPPPSYAPSLASRIPTGRDVHVVVFDTSPFTVTDEIKFTSAMAEGNTIYHEPENKKITWMSQALEESKLELLLAFANPTLLKEHQPENPNEVLKVPDHGLFVAGLIHAIAPGSQIELVQVLNDYGCGDLQTLNESLIQLTLKEMYDRGTLGGTIFNLSLGIHKPRSVHKDKADEIASMIYGENVKERDVRVIEELLEKLEKDEIESLPAILHLTNRKGAVVVAASGNESLREKALPMHIPADYPFVIGVAASNAGRERSCFSNWGDVAAPGGDGGESISNGNAPAEQAVQNLSCLPQHKACEGDCDSAVISLTWDDKTKQPVYAYWSGTSFAAPQVSGLAALVLDASSSECLFFGKKWAAPDRVFDAIRCGAPPPDGVISVPSTLSSRCLP